MKASKFSDAQKAFILKQGEEGAPVAEICRKAGISQATHFSWKKKPLWLTPRTQHIRLIGKLAFSASMKANFTDFPPSRRRPRLF